MSAAAWIVGALLLIFALVLLACSRSPRWDDVYGEELDEGSTEEPWRKP